MSSGAASADDGNEESLGRRIVARAERGVSGPVGRLGGVLAGTGALFGTVPALALADWGGRRIGSNARVGAGPDGTPAARGSGGRDRTAGSGDEAATATERLHRELRADVRGALPADGGGIRYWGTTAEPGSHPTLWLSTVPDAAGSCRPLAGDGFDVARAVTRAHGDGVVIAGNRSPAADAATSDGIAVAVGPSGQVRARHVVDRPAFACCSALCRSADGGYLLAGGSMAADETHTRPWVLKLDDGLDPIWRTNGVRSESDYPRIVRERGDHIALIDGRGDPDEPLRFRTLDRDGAPAAARPIEGTAGVRVRAAAETEGGGLVLTGHRMDASGTARLWVGALDADGRRRWDRTYRRAGFSVGHDVVETSDGLAVAGERTAAAGHRQAVVVTIDRSGTWQHRWAFERGASARSVWVEEGGGTRSDGSGGDPVRRRAGTGGESDARASAHLRVAGVALSDDSRRTIPWDGRIPAVPR